MVFGGVFQNEIEVGSNRKGRCKGGVNEDNLYYCERVEPSVVPPKIRDKNFWFDFSLFLSWRCFFSANK